MVIENNVARFEYCKSKYNSCRSKEMDLVCHPEADSVSNIMSGGRSVRGIRYVCIYTLSNRNIKK